VLLVSGRLEQHLNDISVALDGIGFTLGAIATVLRFYVESQGGQDPLQGTVYEGLGFTDGEDDGPPSLEFPDWVNGS
jgi:hypothetical protein